MDDYHHLARYYALRGITGTDALAFCAVSERIATSGLMGTALDLGCGSGRSTRFLKALSLDAVGVDVSEAMVAEARRLDPEGAYRVYRADERLPFADAAFDVLLSTWVVLELASREALARFFSEASRVLRVGGRGFFVANTEAFYAHRWVSCEVDFPENRAPLRSGQRVKARLMPEGVLVTDTFWSDADYRAAMTAAGLRVAQVRHPLAGDADGAWLDETRVAPWVIYEVERPR
ncbi:MAG: class I SAM-dependent methyltransferase [Chromatiales bacterium]|nr:class I SAM-dependent methyltransferase [Chromatiales bacterium]